MCNFRELYGERFKRIDARLEGLEKPVAEIREKVFNGLSAVPSLMKWMIGITVTLLLATIAGVGAWVYQMGAMEQQILNLQERFIQHDAWGKEQQRLNLERFNALGDE